MKSAGRTQATRYFVDPALLRHLQSAISEIHQRIGGEIHSKQVKRTQEELTSKGSVRFEGDKR